MSEQGVAQFLNRPPVELGVEVRFVHVVGTAERATVFVDDRADDEAVAEAWLQHFVGMIDGAAWWAIDVPAGRDPSYGSSIDLRQFHAIAPEHHWLSAGRAVQLEGCHFTEPVPRPFRQKRCSSRNVMMSGMIDSSAPIRT